MTKETEPPVKNDKDERPPTTLGLNTKITFSLLFVLVSPLFGLAAIYFKMDAIQEEIRRSWTITHQMVWSERLANKNPTVVVPDVRDVVHSIDGQSASARQ